MEQLSHWRRGLVVGALVALTAGAALVAPTSASAKPVGTSTVSSTHGSTSTAATGKHHNAWEW